MREWSGKRGACCGKNAACDPHSRRHIDDLNPLAKVDRTRCATVQRDRVAVAAADRTGEAQNRIGRVGAGAEDQAAEAVRGWRCLEDVIV